MGPELLVINRAADTQRLQRFEARAKAQGWEPRRIAAIDGHAPGAPFFLWRDLIGGHFWGEDEIKPGALACWLSHYRAWETVARGEAEAVLICEDDALLTEGPERLAAADPAAFDILFANDRLAAWAAGAEGEAVSLDALVRGLAGAGTIPTVAPGADCYLLSREGARKLIEMARRDRIVCGVDWAMVFAATDTAAMGGDDIAGWSEMAILAEHLGASPSRLNAQVLTTPVSEQKGGGSVIRHDVVVPLEEITSASHATVEASAVVTCRWGGAALIFAIGAPKDPVQAALAEGQMPEIDALTAFAAAFPDGGTLLDVGAGIGTHSAFIGRFAGAGRVIAIEPDPASAALVAANLAMNGVPMDPAGLGKGLASEEGWAQLQGPEKKPSRRRLRPFGNSGDAQPVEVLTGTALSEDHLIHAIKVDVGGGEFDVLRGCSRLLRQQKPVLMLELSDGQVEKVAGFLDRFGYADPTTFPAGEGRTIFLYR